MSVLSDNQNGSDVMGAAAPLSSGVTTTPTDCDCTVHHDETLRGDGSPSSPLGVVLHHDNTLAGAGTPSDPLRVVATTEDGTYAYLTQDTGLIYTRGTSGTAPVTDATGVYPFELPALMVDTTASLPLTRIGLFMAGWGERAGTVQLAVTREMEGTTEREILGFTPDIQVSEIPTTMEWVDFTLTNAVMFNPGGVLFIEIAPSPDAQILLRGGIQAVQPGWEEVLTDAPLIGSIYSFQTSENRVVGGSYRILLPVAAHVSTRQPVVGNGTPSDPLTLDLAYRLAVGAPLTLTPYRLMDQLDSAGFRVGSPELAGGPDPTLINVFAAASLDSLLAVTLEVTFSAPIPSGDGGGGVALAVISQPPRQLTSKAVIHAVVYTGGILESAGQVVMGDTDLALSAWLRMDGQNLRVLARNVPEGTLGTALLRVQELGAPNDAPEGPGDLPEEPIFAS